MRAIVRADGRRRPCAVSELVWVLLSSVQSLWCLVVSCGFLDLFLWAHSFHISENTPCYDVFQFHPDSFCNKARCADDGPARAPQKLLQETNRKRHDQPRNAQGTAMTPPPSPRPRNDSTARHALLQTTPSSPKPTRDPQHPRPEHDKPPNTLALFPPAPARDHSVSPDYDGVDAGERCDCVRDVCGGEN